MGNNNNITRRQLLSAVGAMGAAVVGAGLLGGCSSSRGEGSSQAGDSSVSSAVQSGTASSAGSSPASTASSSAWVAANA